MDWKLLATTFGVVFLAELGDKTQLATFSLAAEAPSKWAVFLGSGLALLSTTAIAVLFGDVIARVVPAQWLRWAAGAAFLVMGACLLLRDGPAQSS